MKLILHWPQYTMIVIAVLTLLIELKDHGKLRTGTYNGTRGCIVLAVACLILWAGGFYSLHLAEWRWPQMVFAVSTAAAAYSGLSRHGLMKEGRDDAIETLFATVTVHMLWFAGGFYTGGMS
jgi:hypothetical protein